MHLKSIKIGKRKRNNCRKARLLVQASEATYIGQIKEIIFE
jgi:hypothetical protein